MSGHAAVDAHHHFWDPARADYPWLTAELAAIDRAFGPADLEPLLAASSLDETRELLATADASPFVAGVVGWVNLTEPSVGATLDGLRAGAGGARLVGIRHQVHDEPDPEWLMRRDVRRGLQAVAKAGLAYDLLVRPRELAAARETARAVPGLRFVVDHLAKPPIRDGAVEPWATLIGAFGPLENVSCKVSGLVTEADWAGWRIDDLAPYVRHAIDVFGPARLMFGSDWPVCLLAAPYARVIETARALASELSEADRDLLFGGTARRVYRLDATI
jgi:L-fucono-1,5-lactonase